MGKNFPETTCNKNKEGRSESTETISAHQDMALSDIWMSEQVFLNSILLTCVTLNEYFPLEPMGWLHFWHWSRGLLLTLPDRQSFLLVVAVGKQKTWKLSEPGKQYCKGDSSSN